MQFSVTRGFYRGAGRRGIASPDRKNKEMKRKSRGDGEERIRLPTLSVIMAG